MRARIKALLVAIAVAALPTASAQDTSLDVYSKVIDQYRSDPERAVEQATALSPPALTAAPGGGVADASGMVSEHLQAAMLMHLEAALILAKRKDGRARAHIRAGQELGQRLGRIPDHAWFVHRWFLIVTTLFTGHAIRRNALPWNQAIASFETGLWFEAQAMTPPRLFPGLQARTYDTPELGRAVSSFESAASAGVLIAAVHAGRLRMLRGDDTLARRLFEQAAIAPTPSTRYLAHLFLGSMAERDADMASAERHYLAASSAFPYAQSGRLALGALLARSGRTREAANVVGRTPPANLERLFFDPWWLYMPADPFDPSSTMTGMYAEVQK